MFEGGYDGSKKQRWGPERIAEPMAGCAPGGCGADPGGGGHGASPSAPSQDAGLRRFAGLLGNGTRPALLSRLRRLVLDVAQSRQCIHTPAQSTTEVVKRWAPVGGGGRSAASARGGRHLAVCLWDRGDLRSEAVFPLARLRAGTPRCALETIDHTLRRGSSLSSLPQPSPTSPECY